LTTEDLDGEWYGSQVFLSEGKYWYKRKTRYIKFTFDILVKISAKERKKW
jgi:hypothetical protein